MRRLLTFGFILSASLLAQNPQYTNKLAPYVVSPQRVVDRMLELSGLKPGETLYDLGCGDGRILLTAAQRYKARAVGVEISAKLVRSVNDEVQRRGLQNSVRVIEGDLLQVDVSSADVVTVYLSTQFNAKLRPMLEKQLKTGARVVSYEYVIPGWKPHRVDRSDDRYAREIFVYEMPPLR